MTSIEPQTPLPEPIPEPSITPGDEVVAFDLTAETSDTAMVVDFSGTRLVLEMATAFGVGDAIKVEHRKGLLLGEVVAGGTADSISRVVVRCYEWLGKKQLRKIRQKSE